MCYMITHGQAQKVAVAMLSLPRTVVAQARRLVHAESWFDYQQVRRETAVATAVSAAAALVVDPVRIDFEQPPVDQSDEPSEEEPADEAVQRGADVVAEPVAGEELAAPDVRDSGGGDQALAADPNQAGSAPRIDF